MKLSRRAWLLIGGAFVVVFALGMAFVLMPRTSTLQGTPASATASSTPAMRFEIADTQAKQELGLGNRSSIPDDYGMLFVFKDKQRYGFWMKDMLQPIDIVWLSDSATIVLVDHSVDPATYPHVLYPPVPVKYVLETRAGYARDHGWDVGTKVTLPAPYGR